MATETEDQEGAAKRLEAALDRIALAAGREPGRTGSIPPAPDGMLPRQLADRLGDRLDSLIGELRAALDEPA